MSLSISAPRLFEYFVVCGIGPDIHSLDGSKGFHGTGIKYAAEVLDQYPETDPSLYPPPPPQLSTCVLPAGVEFYSSGYDSNDVYTYPRCYPIVLTEGDGTKIYLSCIAFRDPVCEDIAKAYSITANMYADKCICLVSRSPCFQVLRDAVEELFTLCFSSCGSSKPLWDVIAHMVNNVSVPAPGKEHVLFAIENCLLSVEVPSEEGLPHADISFQPLVQCLDVGNLINLFTAVLLERRILLRSNKYTLLTLVSEALCHLIYPFRWLHVYIPLLFFNGVDYIDAPTPYVMGLHSDVDTEGLSMDGVVVVDLEYNLITTSEDIPPLPEPELSCLRSEIMQLLHPNVVGIDNLKIYSDGILDHFSLSNKAWGQEQDTRLRLIFLKFFASLLSGYRNFIEISSLPTTTEFNSPAFLKKRSRLSNQSPQSLSMITQFLESQIFHDYLARAMTSSESNKTTASGESHNLLNKLQDAIGRGRSSSTILPLPALEVDVITVSSPDSSGTGSGVKYCYDSFPSNSRTEEQEEKRRAILAAASGALDISGKNMLSSPSIDPKMDSLSPRERAAERERMVLDIQVKLQGLWLRLLKLGATDDPLSSFEYGTILALIESDAEGIGGSGFVECIREHIHSGWQCRLTEEQFIAVKELLKTAINRATSRNDMSTIKDALEVSAEMYKKDSNNVADYVQRHLIGLSIWEELKFWESYFEYLMDNTTNKMANYVILVTTHLILIASHMVGLGLLDTDTWYIIETIAEKNKLGYKQLIKLRGLLSHMQQLRVGYWGFTSGKIQSLSYGLPSPRAHATADEGQQPAEVAAVGRSWVHSMFSRDATPRVSSFSRTASLATEESVKPNVSPRKAEFPPASHKKIQTSVRILRGHTGAITALHCVSRREVWDLVGDREDAGFFISGSTDCTVKIWDPSFRGSELRATLDKHSRPIRAISSDRGRVVSGSDDNLVIVWDKQTFQPLEELKGHDAPVSSVKMLSGERVISASHDGTIKMWDVRTDTCVATVGRCPSAVLCMEYNDDTGILAAAGRDALANIWDIRAGKQMHKLLGHTKWIRSIRMVGDTVVTGSDDWTARVWSVSRGTCDSVLSCHAGPILCVEYSPADKGIITGSIDGLVRFWENQEGAMKCVKNVTLHSAPILSISAGEHWLGIGAADNSMSLFQRPQERFGGFSTTGSKIAGWQLYRTPQRTMAVGEIYDITYTIGDEESHRTVEPANSVSCVCSSSQTSPELRASFAEKLGLNVVRCVSSDLDRKRICTGGRNGLLRLWEATIKI